MADGDLGRLDPVTGHAGDVTVTLTGLSFRPAGGGRRYPYGEFGSDFIEALHDALASPRRRGLLRSTLVCPLCETSLEGIASWSVAASASVALARIPPIAVDVKMPGMMCPGCGRALVRLDDRNVDSDLSDALIEAMKSVDLKPG